MIWFVGCIISYFGYILRHSQRHGAVGRQRKAERGINAFVIKGTQNGNAVPLWGFAASEKFKAREGHGL